MDAGSAKRMAGDGLRGANKRLVALVLEDTPNGGKLLHVANRCGGAVSIDVVDRCLAAYLVSHFQRKLHAPLPAHTGRRHDIVAIRVGRVADEFSIDAGATLL